MTPPLPDRWQDEPWPLDGPDLRPVGAQRTWSDTHDEPPQMDARLVQFAEVIAEVKGLSMGESLVAAQRMKARAAEILAEPIQFTPSFRFSEPDRPNYWRAMPIVASASMPRNIIAISTA